MCINIDSNNTKTHVEYLYIKKKRKWIISALNWEAYFSDKEAFSDLRIFSATIRLCQYKKKKQTV